MRCSDYGSRQSPLRREANRQKPYSKQWTRRQVNKPPISLSSLTDPSLKDLACREVLGYKSWRERRSEKDPVACLLFVPFPPYPVSHHLPQYQSHVQIRTDMQ